MTTPFGFGNPGDGILPRPKVPWEITHPGEDRPISPGFAARLFSSGDPLEGGLLDPARARGYGNRALLDAGLNILQHSGPQPFRQGLLQLLAGGVRAGRESFSGQTQQGLGLDSVIQQRERGARLGTLQQKYAGRSDLQSMTSLLSELLTGGFTKEADALAGYLSNAVNQQGRDGANPAQIVTHESADGTQLIATDKTTGKEVWRQPLGDKPKGPTDYQQALGDRAERTYLATQENQITDDWNRRIKDIRDTSETISRALALKDVALRGGGVARNQMIVAFVKAIDPGSVAREGEVTLARELANLQDRAKGYVDAATGGVSPKIPEGLVREIADVLERNAKWFNKRWGVVRTEYLNRAKRRGLPNPGELFDESPGYVPGTGEENPLLRP